MDKVRGKRPLEEGIKVPVNISFDESDAKDDELMSIIQLNEKSLGVLANAFYPLWGPLRKELRKPSPKALLFETKLK
ncbi:hypothetical protein TIFTF001_028533 [Ficus carica]|uniref:Uncharacterized protein n=1 Tax=Ficus carica TaxID=3494 RepID=A0AA88DQK5_FICCA|nr:hypothetical protein TIFTF001_028533 [Ficus carica]